MKLSHIVLILACSASVGMAWADPKACGIRPEIIANIQRRLPEIVKQNNGGLFYPNLMWSAIVDRKGVLCSVVKIGDATPISRALAIAKANTANGFSNAVLAMSTANLYQPAQPGGQFYGLNAGNPFNPAYLQQGSGIGEVPGGLVSAAGGVPLYASNKQVIGGLGLSGDSGCADHAIAYRLRRAAGLDHVPAGVGYGGTDNIDYLSEGHPATGFQYPHCLPQDIPPQDI